MDDLNDILVFARVARLEERLGARLIERTTRKLRLTDVGARYHEHARRAILTLEEAAAIVAVSRSRPVGTLRVSASVVMGQTLLCGVVAEFVGRHPDVQVFFDLTNRRVDLVEEGFDLALRAGSLSDSALVARRIGHAGARLYASPGYLRRHGSPTRPADLAAHQLIEGNPTPSATSWTLRHDADGRQERIDARFRLITNDVTTLQTAALAGLGIASLRTFAAHDDCSADRLRLSSPTGVRGNSTFMPFVPRTRACRRRSGPSWNSCRSGSRHGSLHSRCRSRRDRHRSGRSSADPRHPSPPPQARYDWGLSTLTA